MPESYVSSPTEMDSNPVQEVSAEPSSSKAPRDSSWLELQVCRNYNKPGGCPRNDLCRFAHPFSPNLTLKNGKVTCCYDFLKDRCHRERCKYYHPAMFVKEQLVAAGKRFGAMVTYNIVSSPTTYPSPFLQLPNSSLEPSLMEAPASYVPSPLVLSPYNNIITERLQICPEFLRGQCNVQFCHFVHLEPHVRRNFDSTVTVCRDFVRMGCLRPNCRYYHPPHHIMAQLTNATPFSVPPQAVYLTPDVPSTYQLASPLVYPANVVPPQSFPPVPYGVPFSAAGMPIVTGLPVPTSPPMMPPTLVYPVPSPAIVPVPPTSMVPPPVVNTVPPVPNMLPLPLQLPPPPQPLVQRISGERPNSGSGESTVQNDDNGIVSVHKSME